MLKSEKRWGTIRQKEGGGCRVEPGGFWAERVEQSKKEEPDSQTAAVESEARTVTLDRWC